MKVRWEERRDADGNRVDVALEAETGTHVATVYKTGDKTWGATVLEAGEWRPVRWATGRHRVCGWRSHGRAINGVERHLADA